MIFRGSFIGGESNGTVNVSVNEAVERMSRESLLLEWISGTPLDGDVAAAATGVGSEVHA